MIFKQTHKKASKSTNILNFSYFRGPAGFDRTRNAVIGNKDFDLTYLEEAYTSEHWLVRIYRVKKPDEFNRPSLKPTKRTLSDYATKKVSIMLIYWNNLYGINLNALSCTFRYQNEGKASLRIDQLW